MYATRLLSAIFGLIEFLLVLRFVLELLGANPSSQFVAWVYSVSGSLLAPFAGAFPNWDLGGFTIDLSVIFAMIGYAIIFGLISWVLSLLFSAMNEARL
ncbi:MAG: YggT family protein [Candidatus Kaiserbacteria bacterium]|nr:YggT family protein [Candidatus Kaiserbacteria bacterium]